MTRSKKTPDEPKPDLFAQLRAAQAEEAKLHENAYDLAVNALAADPNALSLEEMQEILRQSGFSLDDLERHVAAVRPLVTGADRAIREEIEAAQAEIQAIGEARTAINARLAGRLPDDATLREREALMRRHDQANRRIRTANAKLRELEWTRAALLAELRGEPAPQPTAAPTPEFRYEHTNAPQSSRPPGWDEFDKAYVKKYDERGVVSYYKNGVKIA